MDVFDYVTETLPPQTDRVRTKLNTMKKLACKDKF